MFHSIAQRFLDCRSGSIQIIFALALPVVVIFVAAAAELGGMQNTRTKVQNAVDAATIAAVRANVETDEERSRIASDFINDNLPSELTRGGTVTITVKSDDDHSTTGEATVEVPSTFGGFIGQESFKVEGFTKVKATPHSDLELALVLDTTASMTGSKIETLKTSATELTEIVMSNKGAKVAVVPFARYVNVGLSNRNARGLDIPANIDERTTCTSKPEKVKTNCRTVQGTCTKRSCRTVEKTCYEDGVAYPCKKRECRETRRYSCPKTECDWEETGKSVRKCKTHKAEVWKGCVGSREYPYNTQDDAARQDVPGLLNVSCSSPMQRLTDNSSQVKSAIRALTPDDETYVAPGLLWGWRAISHRLPFADGKDPAAKDDVQKVIVLMSDGTNTLSKSHKKAEHRAKNVTNADRMMEEVCANIKNDGITIYTVAFQINDPRTRKLMKECASDEAHFYFDAKNAADLALAFRAIADDLTDVYIAG